MSVSAIDRIEKMKTSDLATVALTFLTSGGRSRWLEGSEINKELTWNGFQKDYSKA